MKYSRWLEQEPILAPTIVSVTCPNCGAEARFEFAYATTIHGEKTSRALSASVRKDRPSFIVLGSEKFSSFPVQKRHFIRFVRSSSGSEDALEANRAKLPGSLRIQHQYRDGILFCSSCPLERMHHLDWPNDAYWKLNYRGRDLWFYSRDHAVELDAICKTGPRRGQAWSYWYNNNLPTHFKTVAARKALPVKIRQMLS